MPSRILTYDDANMRSKHVGRYGVSDAEWKTMVPRLRTAKKAVQKLSRSHEQGFLHLPSDRAAHERVLKIAERLTHRFTDMVVLGIGGSDLGARSLLQALPHPSNPRQRQLNIHFAGSSTDPEELTNLMRTLRPKRTCINVISKSGQTLETMASFLVLRDLLKRRIGNRTFARHIIATTDPEAGALRELAQHEQYETLSIPPNVGGRFSVLSPVGLLPAAVRGIDTNKLLSGARLFIERFHELNVNECACTKYAGLHVLGMEKRKQYIHVLMPYTRRMGEFAAWVRQLSAESLGKRLTRSNDVVHTGPTPVASIGPEDQHSQLQLYSEGPFDKLITFVRVHRFAEDIKTPDASDVHPDIAYIGNRSFTNLMRIEHRATAESLRQMKRPNGTIDVSIIDERTVGILYVFFEIAVSIMGELLDVNAFNQPGVELSKKIMRNELV